MLRLLREEHFYDLKTKKELNKQTKKKTKWNNLNYTSYRDFIKIVKFNPSIFLTIIFFAKVTINRSVFRKKLYFHNQQRSEEHTSELQSRGHLVCRLLLEKKKII